jgi:hypothetical protein
VAPLTVRSGTTGALVKQRLHQASFREAVIHAYGADVRCRGYLSRGCWIRRSMLTASGLRQDVATESRGRRAIPQGESESRL